MTSTLAGFADLGVPAPVVASLAKLGIETPFPIQAGRAARRTRRT